MRSTFSRALSQIRVGSWKILCTRKPIGWRTMLRRLVFKLLAAFWVFRLSSFFGSQPGVNFITNKSRKACDRRSKFRWFTDLRSKSWQRSWRSWAISCRVGTRSRNSMRWFERPALSLFVTCSPRQLEHGWIQPWPQPKRLYFAREKRWYPSICSCFGWVR